MSLKETIEEIKTWSNTELADKRLDLTIERNNIRIERDLNLLCDDDFSRELAVKQDYCHRMKGILLSAIEKEQSSRNKKLTKEKVFMSLIKENLPDTYNTYYNMAKERYQTLYKT